MMGWARKRCQCESRSSSETHSRWMSLSIASSRFCAFAAIALLSLSSCNEKKEGFVVKPNLEKKVEVTEDLAIEESVVKAFCADCHGFPQASTFPKNSWHREVEQAYGFFFDSQRTHLKPPPMNRVINFFRERAPEKLAMPKTDWPTRENQKPFRIPTDLAESGKIKDGPAVASVVWEQVNSAGPKSFLFCDMRNGTIGLIDVAGRETKLTEIGELVYPARAHACDLDGDGIRDVVATDLGSYGPGDHNKGQIGFFKRDAEGKFSRHIILNDIGRVADVRSGDFDQDGRLDLVVAEFGWRKTGGVWVLRQTGSSDGVPTFEKKEIDARHGSIHVPVVDFDADGDLDFLTILSQEHESIVAYVNDGKGNFGVRTIYEAGHPAFGSSGIELVDMEGDGDWDVVFSNGDAFDSYHVKPYHGVRWLENKGDWTFEAHEIVAMPGVHYATCGDWDHDNDIDIVAVSLLPQDLVTTYRDQKFPSILALEQSKPGVFQPSLIELGKCEHTSCVTGDFDGDGAVDLAVGSYSHNEKANISPVVIYWNEGKK